MFISTKTISFMLSASIAVFGLCDDVLASDGDEEKSSKKIVKILSVDGGGMRGILPLEILKEIEARTGKPICEIFDVMGGTSTGGLITLALNVESHEKKTDGEKKKPKFTASEISQLYCDKGCDIFGHENQTWFGKGGVVKPRYTSEGLESLASELLGDTALSSSLSNIVLTSYNVEEDMPLLFESHRARQAPHFDYLMREVGVGTASAPTYFPAKTVRNFAGEASCVVDGGVIMNNPALTTLAVAQELFPDAEILFVSLGTGRVFQTLKAGDMKEAGLMSWAKPLAGIMTSCSTSVVDGQMSRLLGHHAKHDLLPQHYFRFQPEIDKELEPMDDVRESQIEALKLAARESVAANARMMDDLIACLRIAMPELSQPQSQEMVSLGLSLSDLKESGKEKELPSFLSLMTKESDEQVNSSTEFPRVVMGIPFHSAA